MSALTPVLSKLATSKVEVVGNGLNNLQAKNLESLYLERGFVALLGTLQHGTQSCGPCNSGSSCNCATGMCGFLCAFCCI